MNMCEETFYAAVVGMNHYFGNDLFKVGQIVHLVKDPDNAHDQDAIRVELTVIGKVGYVANSPQTVPRGCRSASRLYDTFEQRVNAIVRFVLKDTVIVEIAPHVKEYYIVTEEEGAMVLNIDK
jgi:hypothetical protein